MTDYSQAKAIIGAAKVCAGEEVQKVLSELKFGETSLQTSLVKLHEAIRRDVPDLIVLDSVMDDNETYFITQEIRAGKLGKSPFPIVIVSIAESSSKQIQPIMDSGADSALLVPFSPATLRDKVAALSGTRVPFVVTRDYIGPDRRTAPRPGATSARLVQVPNPLAPRGDAILYASACEQACVEVFAERVVRLAAQIEWLAQAIKDAFAKGEDLQPLFWKIEDATRELALRVGESAQSQQIQKLRTHAKALRRTEGACTPEALAELLVLSKDLLSEPVPYSPTRLEK